MTKKRSEVVFKSRQLDRKMKNGAVRFVFEKCCFDFHNFQTMQHEFKIKLVSIRFHME